MKPLRAILALAMGVTVMVGCNTTPQVNPSPQDENSAITDYGHRQAVVQTGDSIRIQPQASLLPYIRVSGTLNDGANYELFRPVPWNRRLVVYAHGYIDPIDNTSSVASLEAVFPDLTTLREVMLSLGYAVAWSSYSTNGYAVEAGAADTGAMLGVYKAKLGWLGTPQKTYLMGDSLGSLIIMKLIEQPNSYAGAMPVCGPVNGGQYQTDYIAHTRVLMDWFFGPSPWQPWSSTPTSVESPPSLTDLGAAVYAAASGNPIAAAVMATASVPGQFEPFLLPSPIDYPTKFVESVTRALGYNFRGANDLVSKANGSPFTNQSAFYGLASEFSPYTIANLNAGVGRYTDTGSARTYIENNYTTKGTPRIPTLTVHARGDPEVPFQHEARYRVRVGSTFAKNLVQYDVPRYGHCEAINPAERLLSFFDLVNWVENGKKPTSKTILISIP